MTKMASCRPSFTGGKGSNNNANF